MKTVLPLLLLVPLTAHATLGGGADSIDTDSTQLHSSRHTVAAASAYTCHLLALPTGTTVREFLNAGGAVFAVSWSGPFPPDLRQLLGDSYYQQYHDTALARPGRHAVHLRQSGLMLDVGGHARHFSGRAWVPGLLPAGVSATDLPED